MAKVKDNWFVDRRQPDGSTKRVPSARHGVGLRWQVRWTDGHNSLRKKSFARKVDADQAAKDITAAIARGTYTDPDAGNVRFRDFAEQWRMAQFSDPATEYQVGIRLRLHVYPAFGHLPLRAITPTVIRQWSAGLRLARSYQRTIFANVSQVFGAAIADDLITKNPCRSPTVRKPIADPRKITPWPTQWVVGVHEALPDRFAVLLPLGAGCGLRQGEAFALSPDDIDITRGLIAVNRQIKLSASNQAYFAPPKGRKTRSVPMPDYVREAIEQHRSRFPTVAVMLPWDRPDGDPITVRLLVTTREATATNRHYFNAKIWKPALAAVGIPPVRENGFHALRHHYASVLLDGGESIKTVSERLGHADPGFTLRTYTHLLPDSESRTKSIIDSAFRPNPRPSPRSPIAPRPPPELR